MKLRRTLSGKYRNTVLATCLVLLSSMSFAQSNSQKTKGKQQPKADKMLKAATTDTPLLQTAGFKDTDGDGIADSLDKCPDEKGVLQYDGCPVPDSDNDGIADDLDECPLVAGLIKYKGCPAGDKDGDKINDDEDKCPDVPGLARFDGCPTRDTDNDGVNDDDDKCPTVAGTAANSGCPDTKEYRKLLKKQDGKKKSTGSSDKNKK